MDVKKTWEQGGKKPRRNRRTCGKAFGYGAANHWGFGMEIRRNNWPAREGNETRVQIAKGMFGLICFYNKDLPTPATQGINHGKFNRGAESELSNVTGK